MMQRKYLILLFCILISASVIIAEGTFFAGGWKLSVGAAYNAPSKLKLNFNPARFASGTVLPTAGYTTYEEALQEVNGTQTSDSRHEYENGLVFVDTDCSQAGTVEEGTWNVRVLKDSWDATRKTFVLAKATYETVETLASGTQGTMKLHVDEEEAMPGVTAEISHNLYANPEQNWGVDLAFAFSYFFRTDMFSMDSSSAAYLVHHNELEATVAPTSGRMISRYIDGDYYGAGTYEGPGPTFKDIIISDREISVERIGTGDFRARGDYRDLELLLALRPYYDLYDWLRLYGMLGVAVSRAEFNLSVHSTQGSYKRDYDDWDVYGMGGLGLMLRWNDFYLGVDVMARFLDDRLDIDDDIVSGSLRRGRWVLRGMLGYEF